MKRKEESPSLLHLIKTYKIFFIFIFLGIVIVRTLQAQQIFINEFLTSNVTINPEMVDFDDYSDWLEIYNAENHSVDLGGYYLTDDLNDPTKWRIPEGTIVNAKGYLLFWADGQDDVPGHSYVRSVEPYAIFTTRHYHLNFKLSKEGEEIGLYNTEATLIDSVVFGPQLPDVSYGRKPNGGPDWFLFGEPTPGEANRTEGIQSNVKTVAPEFSLSGGFYPNGQTIEITTDSPSATIRFTLDGSRPSSTSTRYTSPIQINSTTVLRARTFDVDQLPSPIVTETYFINVRRTLPVLSIAAFPEILFDEDIGIYWNLLKAREIPVHFELYEATGEKGLDLDAGMRLTGQGAYLYPQKPLTIYARDRFGAEAMRYRVFPDRDIHQFTTLYLRTSGCPDNRYTLFRDALQHCLVINQMDLDCQAYRPAATFINGQYWGIYNIREKLDEDYLASHHKIDPNNIDFLEYDFSSIPVVVAGDADHYNAMLDFLETHDMSLPENYATIKTQMDINEYLNYQITEIYCDNINWLNTNVRWWRERTDRSKWRWILVDLDWGFGTFYPNFSSYYANNTLEMAVSTPGSLTGDWPWATFLFRKLLENTEFKNEFIQRFASYLNTTFDVNRVVHMIDSLKNQLSAEMVWHIDRWKDNPDVLIFGRPPIPDMNAWNNDVEVMREFAIKRPDYQRQQIVDFFELSGTADLTLNILDPNSGRVKINHVPVPAHFTGVYFKDIPVELEAIPNVGYRFSHWEGPSNSDANIISLFPNENTNLTAVFETTDVSILPSRVTADMTLTMENAPYFSNGDVTVEPGVTLKVEPGVEIQLDENASIVILGKVEMDGTANDPIILKPNGSHGSTQWGCLSIIDGTGVSTLTHVHIEGASQGDDPDRDIGAISSYRSDIVLDHVMIEDAPFPVFSQYGNVAVQNCTFHSDKICDLINVKYASSALVEGCDLRGSISYDSDAIDYDGIRNGVIRGNTIYHFYGINSDGIDLGEGCKNCLIEHNLIFDCTDKGISVGQASTAIIKHNVIVNCAQGVGIKDDSSYAFIERNTFYGNDYPVACFEKNIGAGGGRSTSVNCIFAQSKIASYFVDDLSEINISYSLSDAVFMPGVGNICADPLFGNNFRLMPGSPAIDAGDPGSSPDPDGSRADMGAYAYTAIKDFIMINEIHYRPANGEVFEFIELCNAGSSAIDISGFHFTDGIDFTFPPGTGIDAGEYVVVANNAASYQNQGFQVFEWIGEPLSDLWSNIRLVNEKGELVDYVSYSTDHGWATSGPSMELRDPSLENLYTANWRRSFADGGSPGKPNIVPLISDLYINEFLARNNTLHKDENGEFDDWIEIYNAGERAIDLGGLYVTDDLNNPTKHQMPLTHSNMTTIPPKNYLILWADEDTEQGVLHVNFRLGGDGEQIGVVQVLGSDTVFIDQLSYGDQSQDISFGREPDGNTDWAYYAIPTPGKPNTLPHSFDRGVLLVNGVSFGYGESLLMAYENRAFWGSYPISFWDCLDAPPWSYPPTLPEPLGHGVIPYDLLIQFSTVIWIGNNQGGDLDCWKLSSMYDYLKAGGNLILITRLGYAFLDDDMLDYLGIQWVEQTSVTFHDCIATYSGLRDIDLRGNQNSNSVFSTVLKNDESLLLFQETLSFDGPRGIGVWHKPKQGGAYRREGGHFVFLSGRPYRYNYFHLRSNITYMLEHFFHESKTGIEASTNVNSAIHQFRLHQNYPNPFNPQTTIRFDVPRATLVSIRLYNIQGKLVRTFIDSCPFEAGAHEIVWNGRDESENQVGSGTYFCRMEAGEFCEIRKILLLR